MRAAIVGAVSLIVSAAHAGTPWLPRTEPNHLAAAAGPHEPLALYGQMHFIPRRRGDLPLLGPQFAPPASPGFSIGPLRGEGFTAEPGKGRRMRFQPHYRLEGVSVMGGSIGGSLDARGGMLTLNWHTSQ